MRSRKRPTASVKTSKRTLLPNRSVPWRWTVGVEILESAGLKSQVPCPFTATPTSDWIKHSLEMLRRQMSTHCSRLIVRRMLRKSPASSEEQRVYHLCSRPILTSCYVLKLIVNPRSAPRQEKSLLTVMISYLPRPRSEEHTSELQSLRHLVCRLLLEK